MVDAASLVSKSYRPTLDRALVWQLAVEAARSETLNPYAGFEQAGRTASVLGCDIGAIALPYLFTDDAGSLTLVLASAAHRPDGRVVARVARADRISFVTQEDESRVVGSGPPETLRILFDWELARRPVMFVMTDGTSALTSNAADSLQALGAEPVDVTGTGFWQRKVVVVIDVAPDSRPRWDIPLTRMLCHAGALVVAFPVDLSKDAASTISIRLEALIDELGRDRTTIIWPAGLPEPLSGRIAEDGRAVARFRHLVVCEPSADNDSRSCKVPNNILSFVDEADAVASRDAAIWIITREASKARSS